MEVWSGSVVAPPNVELRGIHLLTASSTSECDWAKNAKLSFRAFVNPALVPLYLLTGPLLEVHISDEETATWLTDRLLSSTSLDPEELDELHQQQCPVAVLLAVEESGKRANQHAISAWQRVTDVLIYGVLSLASAQSTSPSTSPSPISPDSHHDGFNVELGTYAVCLCGGRETKVQALSSPPHTPEGDDGTGQGATAEFLPDMQSPSPKRKRVATLFEAAAEFHKRARQRGGVVISDFECRKDAQSFSDSPYMKIKREKENGPSATESALRPRAGSVTQTGLSRSATMSSSSNLTERPRVMNTSGKQSTSTLLNSRSQSSHHGERTSKSITPATTGSTEETISTNKTLLTRTILTCMRLYGYHRSSRGTARPTPPASAVASAGPADYEKQEQNTVEADEDDEFKAMYHTTYRASTFALRKYLKPSPAAMVSSESSVPILERDKAMDVVDSLLKIFCEQG
ncbi:hypothetical protein VTO42DRAFT_726 [Malbranchea cinnamomea]